MNQNPSDKDTSPRSVDQQRVCSAVELASVLRAAKNTGTMVGNAINNLGLVKYPQKKRWSKLCDCEFVSNIWFDEETAPLAEVDMTALVELCKSGKIKRVRKMGAKGIALLWKALKLPMPDAPRCKCCGQLLPKHMVEKQNSGDMRPSPNQRLTDVETELRQMAEKLSAAGIDRGLSVLRLAADIVAMSGRQAAALRDATTLIGEIMRDEVNAQDECEKWLRAYCPNDLAPAPAGNNPNQNTK